MNIGVNKPKLDLYKKALPDEPKDDPSEWMTSREYARTQGFETLGELIKHKIKEDQNESDTKIEMETSPLCLLSIPHSKR